MRALLLACLVFNAPAMAHEVIVETGAGSAMVLRLQYADGQPFAFEAYELYPTGSEVPAQVGRTDARGRVVFLADAGGEWRLKAWSADGHGVDRRFSALGGGDAVTVAAPPSRTGLVAAGLGSIFGLFGLWQLFVRRKS